MPLKGNVRYRVKTTKRGKKVRLAFKGNKVVEAKNLKTGSTHTPAEFPADGRPSGTGKKPSGSMNQKKQPSTRRKSIKQLFPY